MCRHALTLLLVLLSLLSVSARAASSDTCKSTTNFGYADPSSQNVDPRILIDLTNWVRESPVPIFSLLISRNGKVIYQLLTPHIAPDDAHYLMSVTKSVTSALVGAAIDRRLLQGPDQAVADLLPTGDVHRSRFTRVTLKDVLAMSALDAPVMPHETTIAARTRSRNFMSAPNRFAFALKQNLLAHPGMDFQYTEITPMIAVGLVERASGQSLLDFAKDTLFDPMGFRNEEWMHQDAAGYDNGAYGLRLRPIDMQKFGILFLAGGCWEGRQLLSPFWVNTSFTPWIRSEPGMAEPNYGWFWWRDVFASGAIAHSANGWKGQRISVFPDLHLVVTMTALVENDTEDDLFATVINRFIIPAVSSTLPADEQLSKYQADLRSAIDQTAQGPTRVPRDAELRMIPSATWKETHHPLLDR